MTFIARFSVDRNWRPGHPPWEQPYWDEHAAFINALHKDGLLYMGGVLADFSALCLIVESSDATMLMSRLQIDPWVVKHVVQAPSLEEWLVLMDPRLDYAWPISEKSNR